MRRPFLSVKSDQTGGTIATVGLRDDLKVVAIDGYNAVLRHLYDTIPGIGTIKIDLIAEVINKIRRVVDPIAIRAGLKPVHLDDRISIVEKHRITGDIGGVTRVAHMPFALQEGLAVIFLTAAYGPKGYTYQAKTQFSHVGLLL